MNNIIYNVIGVTNNKLLQTLIVIIFALFAQIAFSAITTHIIKTPIKLKSVFPKEKSDDLNKRIKTLSSLIGTVATLIIWLIAIIIILGIFGVPIAALITSAGLIGAALAFGMQNIIKDLISGVFIISENQYRIGDYVVLDKAPGNSKIQTAGIVKSISVRSTVLQTADGSILHIPNGSIINTSNYSMSPICVFIDIDVKTSFGIKKINNALKQIENKINDNLLLSKMIVEAPKIEEIIKITGETISLQISFKTEYKNKQAATNAIWQAIERSSIELQA